MSKRSNSRMSLSDLQQRRFAARRRLAIAGIALLVFCVMSSASAQVNSQSTIDKSPSIEEPTVSPPSSTRPLLDVSPTTIEEWSSPEGFSSAIQVMVVLTVLSLAPAVLLMTTCFIRIVVVLGLLRQALGTQQLPPSQVITSIALFMTLLIMTPVWTEVYDEAIVPYTHGEVNPDTLQPFRLFASSKEAPDEAFERAVKPIRRFMSQQIENAGNSDDIWLFYEYLPNEEPPETYDDVALPALLPAFMLSELKTAFLIGFQIYLPFLVLDIVVASVTISMGMMMLPPVMISLPFKLLLFVLVDGWHLVVGMLLESFVVFT